MRLKVEKSRFLGIAPYVVSWYLIGIRKERGGNMEKLLIAETSRRFSQALTHALQDRYEVHCCSDGDAARSFLESLQPQVLILNLALPYMDGLQVLLSSTYKPPVILAMTTIATN